MTNPGSSSVPAPDDIESSDDELHSQLDLKRSMAAMSLSNEFPRYLGKSSRMRFFKVAYDMKSSLTGGPQGLSLFNERLRQSMNRAKYIRSQPVRPFFNDCILLIT